MSTLTTRRDPSQFQAKRDPNKFKARRILAEIEQLKAERKKIPYAALGGVDVGNVDKQLSALRGKLMAYLCF